MVNLNGFVDERVKIRILLAVAASISIYAAMLALGMAFTVG